MARVEATTTTAPVQRANAGEKNAADRFLEAAMKFKGQPYRWGGGHGGTMNGPGPVDCSGLIQQAARQSGINLDGTAAAQQRKGQPVNMKDLKPGDLVFRGNPAHHVGIYIGNGQVLHAPKTGDVVRTVPVSYFNSARRVFGEGGQAMDASAAGPATTGGADQPAASPGGRKSSMGLPGGSPGGGSPGGGSPAGGARPNNSALNALWNDVLEEEKKHNGDAAATGNGDAAAAEPSGLQNVDSKSVGNFGDLVKKLEANGVPLEKLQQLSEQYQVPLPLILGVIQQESGGDPSARSGAGAQGLMQLMPGTAEEMGVKNPMDPMQNVEGGVKYLAKQLKAFNGDTRLALAAYNAGAGNVQKYGGIPPFAETQNYVATITASLQANRNFTATA